ncbi:MAG: energy transducer TonB [Bryobacteraceae bacterium]
MMEYHKSVDRSFGGFASSVAAHAVVAAAVLLVAVPDRAVQPTPIRTALILYKPAAPSSGLRPRVQVRTPPVPQSASLRPRTLFVPASRHADAPEPIVIPASPSLSVMRSAALSLVPAIATAPSAVVVQPPHVVSDAGFGASGAIRTSNHGAGAAVSLGSSGFGAPGSGWGSTDPEVSRVVSDSGFGAMAAQAPRPVHALRPAQLVSESVQILRRPRPQYTDEARRLQIEGEVVLEAVFTASGEVRVVRVVRGLGHGLDENAVAAARNIHFIPARMDGRPVDRSGTVRLTFQLAY